ncbi:metallophosphoesterase [Pelagibius sp. CAU 1746]|uniref:metallophosphoesterase family protein n=1 Tax=Pelagibius sp. CAU 1746 TaxID=3140370 RepID=UPI00325BEA81
MTTGKTDKETLSSPSRRDAMKCLAWSGGGVLWTLVGGVPVASALSGQARADTMKAAEKGTLSFVQVSDSHIGFTKAANPDSAGTFQAAIDLVNQQQASPALVLHTGDVTHLSKPEEFDTAAELMKGLRVPEVHVVPGEHDVLDRPASAFFERYGYHSSGKGWYSFDHSGVHFIGLINVLSFSAGSLGALGSEQLKWLEDDLKGRSASQPIVVFAHMPLWTVYQDWGWGTGDAEQAMTYLRRFGSVTVLNGHIHQIVQKVEGNIRFHTAASTAFPQPPAGQGKGPGPMKVPSESLRRNLGLTSVSLSVSDGNLALTDHPLPA